MSGTATRSGHFTKVEAVLHLAFELGDGALETRIHDGVWTEELLSDYRRRRRRGSRGWSGSGEEALSCYEAGRDGFWIHRCLEGMGIENVAVDSSSIEVNRRKGRAKIDRLDVGKLTTMLVRYNIGEKVLSSSTKAGSS